MTGLISLAFSIAMIPWRAFVLLKLWVWFLVPIWPAIAIPKWNLYGLAIIITFLVPTAKSSAKVDTSWWVEMAVLSFVLPALWLLTGWLIKVICL